MSRRTLFRRQLIPEKFLVIRHSLFRADQHLSSGTETRANSGRMLFYRLNWLGPGQVRWMYRRHCVSRRTLFGKRLALEKFLVIRHSLFRAGQHLGSRTETRTNGGSTLSYRLNWLGRWKSSWKSESGPVGHLASIRM